MRAVKTVTGGLALTRTFYFLISLEFNFNLIVFLLPADANRGHCSTSHSSQREASRPTEIATEKRYRYIYRQQPM